MRGQCQKRTNTTIVLVDSISDFSAGGSPCVVVTGSHCGIGVAQYLARAAVCGLLGNDAGARSGAAALATLDRFGVPAATVSSATARIGRAGDTLEHGVVSALNAMAAQAGLRRGMRGREAAARLDGYMPVILPEKVGYRPRRRSLAAPSARPIVLVDSASLVVRADAGAVIVTGSHGGLVGGLVSRGLRANAALAIFNDAGKGIAASGIERLAVLESAGVPAAAIAAGSARIGSALSTYRTGMLSAVNNQALAAGLRIGMAAKDAVWAIASVP